MTTSSTAPQLAVTPIVRAPDWEERLAIYLDRISEQPFVWGQNDCALMAMGAVRAMTSTDPAALFRGGYDSREGSAQALRDWGAGTLLKTITAWFGAAKHPGLAHRGDIVMRDRHTLGVCVGLHSWFVGEADGQHGLVALPTIECTKAFSVPYSSSAASSEAAR